jgi:hypothetical protein
MSDTLTNVRANLRARLDETTARFWADTELTTWINEGARDVARRGEILESTSTINTVAGTQQYSMPADTLRVYRVEWSRDGATGTTILALEYKDFNSMDSVWWSQQKTSRGDPYWFTMWGFPPNLNLVVYPTPDATVTAGLKLYYYRLPLTVVSGSDVVECPAGWEDLILDYAEYSAWRKDGNPQWQESKQLYEEKLANLINTSRRWSDQSDSIQGTRGILPGWVYDPNYGW